MANYAQTYQSKLRSLDDALRLIQSGNTVYCGRACSSPLLMLENLHRAAAWADNVRVITGQENSYLFQTLPEMRGHILSGGTMFGPGMRQGAKLGNSTYYPGNLHAVAGDVVNAYPVDVAIAAVTPMDENGWFQIPFCLMGEVTEMAHARSIILEVNPNIPRIASSMGKVHINQVTALLEVDYPLMTIPSPEPGPLERTIGGYVAELVRDGDCIQLGIGALPNAVGEALMDKHDLGLHTEMFTDIMGQMIQRGVITGARKNFHPGKHLGTFALGSDRLYRILSREPNVMMVSAAYGNDPFNVAQNDNMVSINTTLEMDLTGQACSESIGSLQYSGTGGATDYAYGATHSKGGRSILALASTAKGGAISKIKTQLTPGAVVSISRNIVDYVVTEYGVARLRGKSVRDRTQALIGIAHPDFRQELTAEARKLLLL